MTAPDLSTEALRRLLDEATPGPWIIRDCESIGHRCTHYYQEVWSDNLDVLVATEVTRAHNDGGRVNMRLITLAPALAREVLRLREALEDCMPVLSAVTAGDTGYTKGWAKQAHDKACAALTAPPPEGET